MSTVGDLMTRYGSDKNNAHSYGPVYDELFAPKRHSATNILEVGVMYGASLYAWRDYFPNAHIVGMDHHSTPINDFRICTVRADSRDPKQIRDGFKLSDVKIPFDIVIDDGGHWLEEQIPTFQNLREFIRPGGLYVVEDIQSIEAMEWFRANDFEVRDLRGVKGRGDDILAIFRG